VIRYGVIGTGMMGIEHIENILAIEGATVGAICDPDESSRRRGAQAARQNGGGGDLAVFDDHRDLLDRGDVDAVVVVSPNNTHAAVMRDVLDAGVHVLCEKPLCTTVPDIRELMARADATGGTDGARKVWMGLEYRYMPAVAELISDVHNGVVGDPKMVAIREHRFPFLVKVGNWNRFSENTGGTLVEKCCHFFDLMNLVLDERPSRVMASGAQDVNHLDEIYEGRRSDILDNAFVIVDYPSGARALLDLCMFAEATRNQEELSVVGDRGKIEALLPEGVIRTGIRGEHWIGSVNERHADESHIAYQGLHHGSSYVEHLKFFDAIQGRGPIEVTLDDGLWSVAMGVAAHRSIETGNPISMNEVMS
jgi:predicted dehydrogenase